MIRLRLVPVLCLAALYGCHDSSATASTGAQGQVVAPDGSARPFGLTDPRLSVAHRGIRRFETPGLAGPAGSYRERITTDGHGRYALEPIDSQAFDSFEWEPFELIMRSREGFLFRYRDFLVRDPVQFARNWSVTALPQLAAVAGRPCNRFRVQRNVGEPMFFELCIDSATGLVLAYHEFEASGRLVSSMTYESVELDPDARAIVWHEPSNAEELLNPLEDLEAQVGERLLRPRLLPPGYRLLEAATVGEAGGRRWYKLTYSNGVEPLFLMQALVTPDGSGPSRRTDPTAAAERKAASSVVVFQVGTATAIQGTVDGFELVVIGRVSEPELLDLIESSRP